MQVTCRRQDIPLFEALGFHLEFEQADNCPIVELIDEEANYAHYDELPRDLPYHGFHGPGGNYGAHHLACDGKQYADVETGHDGGYLIHWNDATRQPDEPSLRRIHEYLAILESARQQLTTNQG